MRHILVTAVSGTGKSTLARWFVGHGFEAYNIEELPGLFTMCRKSTGAVFHDIDNSNPEMVADSEWICDEVAMHRLLEGQVAEVAFYCGVASNLEQILGLFDGVLLLSASEDVLYQRLLGREGTTLLGGSEASRRMVLGWKDWWERRMIGLGAVPLLADGLPAEVAKAILREVCRPAS